MTDLAELPPPLSVEEAIAQVSAVLDNLRAAAVAPFAAVNPDGTPGNVAAGELIESAWGNATANTIGVLTKFRKDQLWSITPMLTVAAPAPNATGWKSGGTKTVTTDAAGLVALTYGFTTNGGVLSWSAASGDTAAWWGYAARQGVSSSAVTIMCLHHDGNPWANKAVRVDYEITGWNNP